MTLKLEWDGLLYGVLALTTIASITGLAARASKLLLPPPPRFSQTDTHLDSRDVVADLITSWEIIPSLLKGDFTHAQFRSRGIPSPSAVRRRVIFLFCGIAITTIAAETALILSTGTVRSDLKIPQVQNFTFIGRHLVADNDTSLEPIEETLDRENACITKGEVVFNGRRYAEYVEVLCVRKTLKKDVRMRNFVIRTEFNSFDVLGLWLGTVVRETKKKRGKPFDKTTYAVATATVSRRVAYDRRSEKRVLDKATALRLAQVIQNKSGCSMRDVREQGTLDNRRLQRPANIANYTCASPIPTAQILDCMADALVQGFGKYYYRAPPSQYRIPADAEVVRLQRERKVGVQLSRAYEPMWFAFMAAMSALGAAVWAWDRLVSGSVYPSVGLLALLTEIEHTDECCVNEIFRAPVALYLNERVRGDGLVTTTFVKIDSPCANVIPAQAAGNASVDTLPDVQVIGAHALAAASTGAIPAVPSPFPPSPFPPSPFPSSPYPPSPVWNARGPMAEDNVVAAHPRILSPRRRRDFFFRRVRDDRTPEQVRQVGILSIIIADLTRSHDVL